jgi:cellulose biosynthesis protein BcsQ
MYVVTFYSFKGGVGRTMALVNVGVELARTGRRVLMVDFDLEAPGLETFDLPRPQDDRPGLVDYVSRYVETGETPDVSEYVYECIGVGERNGKLWIMPAGLQDGKYGERLNSIDWQELYSERDGFLMFEDMKAQWSEVFAPDYVLIDSRTGHTDVGGICTRHLPDAVVLFFFPTEQNLRGLRRVVSDVRNEARGSRKKEISLHFVTSNIPDLDDEDQILEARIERFRQDLGYKQLSATIHHYNSLALLNQAIFTQEHPRSRLTREYRKLLKALVRQNPEDREGASEFLQQLTRRTHRMQPPADLPASELESRLADIRKLHSNDGSILCQIAVIREHQGRLEEAIALLSEAADAGHREPEVFLRRAELRRLLGDRQGALADVESVLDAESATYFEVSRAARWFGDLASERLPELPSKTALRALDFDGRLHVAAELQRSRRSLLAAEMILRQLVDWRDATPEQRSLVATELAVCLIGLQRFGEAMTVLGPERPTSSESGQHVLFNYAMAEWAETGRAPRDLLEILVELDRQSSDETESANYSQCLAIAYGLLGDQEEARRRIGQARQRIMGHPFPQFSAWRYLSVTPPEFLADLDSISTWLESKEVTPSFIEAGVKQTSR